MAPFMPASSAESVPHYLQDKKDEAIRTFYMTKSFHAYSSPRFLRSFLEQQLSELPYDTNTGCASHSMLLLPKQAVKDKHTSFLSILCAECRYHFHVDAKKTYSRDLDDTKHPSHMLIPVRQWFPADYQDRKSEYFTDVGKAEFICAAEGCFYTVSISVVPPKLTAEQVAMLNDDNRILRNLQHAREEDPQRYIDVPDTWAAGTAVPTLAQYLEDRLAKSSGDVLRIKKRNKRFRVAFGKDFDDLLRSLGFEERTDDDGEECWYITEPTALTTLTINATVTHTRKAHLQDILEELRTLFPNSKTTPAWTELLEAFQGYLPRREVDLITANKISEDDLALLGCLRECSPRWFSWAATLLASLCPPRRDEYLDAGLRCIQERSEEASLSIIMYKSQFDQMASVDRQVQAAYEFFGASLEDGKDTNRILNKYRTIIEADPSDSFRAEAFQHLEVISNHLGADLLGDVARGDSLAVPTPSIGSSNRRMSIGSASRLLNVETGFTAEMIRDFAVNVDERVDRRTVVEALEVLSDLKLQQDKPSEAQSLKEAADFLLATGNIATSQPGVSSGNEQLITAGPALRFTTPPGLKNIGNTCYLNSLLQYFYNVRAVRDMVLNYDQIQLGLDDLAVSNRRTGGNGTPVTLEEAIVARQFIEELRRLFSELQTTTGAAGSPSQKLANTALSSAKEILTSQYPNQPPPLPARPSPAPPASPRKITTVNVTVEPVNEEHDTASSTSSQSSQTLVNETDDAQPKVDTQGDTDPTASVRQSSLERQASSDTVEHLEDVTMQEPPPPPTLDEKITQISQRLEKSDRSGTSQQDVEEIIGNILEHLMRAIRPDGPMEGISNLQADKITKLFFTTIVNSTIKTRVENAMDTSVSSVDEDVLNEEVVPERWITAFPHPDKEHKMKNNLYEALDRYFSYELLSDGGLARYTTIRALPPIVHICIQRTDASGVKNKNPVIIPEDLYLDRYMEAAAGSVLWNTRRRVWAIKERIKELQSRTSYTVENILKAPGSHSWNAYAADRTQEGQYSEYQEVIDWNSELWRDIARPSKRTPETALFDQPAGSKPSKRRSISYDAEIANSNFTGILWEAGQRADEVDSTELVDLRKEEAGAFDSMKRYKYCLHAMICHGGGMNAGHYWVWVRDFKNQVWYKYNDSLVTEDSRDSQQVIDELNNSGDPYYVAYVRDELKDDLVEVPQRAQREDDAHMINNSDVELEVIDSIVVNTPPQPANSPVNTPVQEEVVMEDAPPHELQS
ncbi:cysteine proteinase [Xylariaceae sp. AK1471]|nr:cysteine proteinase [Xylariaceae sp. AK1471]